MSAKQKHIIIDSVMDYSGSLTRFYPAILLIPAYLFFKAVLSALVSSIACLRFCLYLSLFVFSSLCFAQAKSAQPDGQSSQASDTSIVRRVAGLDPVVLRQLFQDQASHNDIMQLSTNNGGTLARFRKVMEPYQIGVLSLVERDSDLLAENTATLLQAELTSHNWPVLLVSADGFIHDKSAISEAASKGIEFLIQEQAVASVLLLVSEHTLLPAMHTATELAEKVGAMILIDVSDHKLPNKDVMTKLGESQLSILDIVFDLQDKKALAQRRHWFNQQGFIDGYRLMSAPSTKLGEPYIVKRVRAWLDSRFIK